MAYHYYTATVPSALLPGKRAYLAREQDYAIFLAPGLETTRAEDTRFRDLHEIESALKHVSHKNISDLRIERHAEASREEQLEEALRDLRDMARQVRVSARPFGFSRSIDRATEVLGDG